MASTQTWSEGNGTNASIETSSRNECNWKNIDDSTSLYSSYPITAGNNSYSKYQAIKFGGTYNTLSSLNYKVSTNSPGVGLTVAGGVVTAGTTPTTTATGDGSASTTGVSANFTTTTMGFATGSSSTSSNPVYGNAFRTQLQTTGSAVAGDISSVTITATWTES